MRIIIRSLWRSLIVALLLFGVATSAHAQTPGTQYFPETHHTVSGEFLTFYLSLKDPYLILGYPISEQFEDAATHYLVQYFQLGRLELHPEAPSGSRVTISNLGEIIYVPGAPLANIPNDSPACRYFQTTEKSVCYAFLRFYDENNGPVYFGDPISQTEVRDGRYVQYFQKTRMEWRPELPSGQRVGLTAMGSLYFEIRDEQQQRNGSPIIGTPSKITLQVRAFVSRSLLPANSQQTLYIIVQDQAFNPISQAVTGVTITLPDGREQSFRPPVTDANGISTFVFNIGQVDAKQMIKVEATASYGGANQKSDTWFRIWY